METKPIQLDLPELTALQIARRCYGRWKTDVPFEIDFRDYLEHGIVVTRPDVFLMAKLVDRRPRGADGKPIGEHFDPALFVRMAVGNLRQLLVSAFAALYPARVPWIRFCRHGNLREREYDFEKMMRLATKLHKENYDVSETL